MLGVRGGTTIKDAWLGSTWSLNQGTCTMCRGSTLIGTSVFRDYYVHLQYLATGVWYHGTSPGTMVPQEVRVPAVLRLLGRCSVCRYFRSFPEKWSEVKYPEESCRNIQKNLDKNQQASKNEAKNQLPHQATPTPQSSAPKPKAS
jgi:hypothetical protein